MILIMKKLQWFRPKDLFEINHKAVMFVTFVHCTIKEQQQFPNLPSYL